VFYETGKHTANSQKQPGIKSVFPWETTPYRVCFNCEIGF